MRVLIGRMSGEGGGRGGDRCLLMKGEIGVYHVSLPAVLADAHTGLFISCLPDCC